MECKFCESNNIKKLKRIKSPHNGYEYTFYKCNTCKSHFFDLSEHNYDLEKLYNDLADRSSYPEKLVKSKYWENEIKTIISLKDNITNVMDVGCRTGDFLMHWNDNILRNGIELSKRSAKIAKNRNLNIYEDFIENINFKNEKFDVVTCYAVLEHLENPISVINELTKIVDDNGVLVIMIPYFDSIKARMLYFLNYRWHMFSQTEHLNFYSKKFLDNTMKKNGFELQKAKYTSGGMFNPFSKIPLVRGAFGRLMNIIDFNSPVNKIPLFDHMYLYYKKTK